MKLFLLISSFIFLNTALAETKIVDLRSDKGIYSAGDTAVLRANFLSKPDNSDFQFDITAKLNGQSLPVDRVTDFQMFSSAKNLVAGNYTWQVSVVVQDARYARDLKSTIQFYSDAIAGIDTQIATETDPAKLLNLQKRRADDISIKQSAINELNQIRTPVLAPLTLQFSVQ